MYKYALGSPSSMAVTDALVATARRCITTNAGPHCAKNVSLDRQGKIMGKLFGDRVAGSKKRWYPTQNETSSTPRSAVLKTSQFGKPAGGGKNTTRRMTVLNKLFMKHITDLLATGEASEAILGRGLQVSRVKISNDFTGINVYWQSGRGELVADVELERELKSCSGLIRHELSQLSLMGQVPRINFVRDRTNGNLAQVEMLLHDMDFGPADEDNEEEAAVLTGNGEQQLSFPSRIIREDFFGKSSRSDAMTTRTELLPQMRHDVLGLDHRDIMSKILTKMRKSKQAWDLHNQAATVGSPIPSPQTEANTGSQLERIQEKLSLSMETAENFDKFLAKRRDRKHPSDRKHAHRGDDEWLANAGLEVTASDVSSKNQRRLHDEEDFLHEHEELANERKS